MFPPSTADELRRLGHDAICVAASELAGADDDLVYEISVVEQRTVVTENVKDFARLLDQRLLNGEPVVAVVCVLKRRFSPIAAIGPALANRLDRWARDNPDPQPGRYWP